MDMKEKRQVIGKISEFLAYKIRSGEISPEIGDKIFRIVLKEPELVDDVENILDMDMPEDETLKRVERLVG